MTVKELKDEIDAYLALAPEAGTDEVFVQVSVDHQPRRLKEADMDWVMEKPILLLTDGS